MNNPWRELKEAEMKVIRQRQKGKVRSGTLSRLRKLVVACGQDPGADVAICYHGSLSLLFEFDRDWPNAVKHRRLEISKIRSLHRLEEKKTTGGYATQNYEAQDLSERREILEQLKRRIIAERGSSPNRRPPIPQVRTTQRRSRR